MAIPEVLNILQRALSGSYNPVGLGSKGWRLVRFIGRSRGIRLRPRGVENPHKIKDPVCLIFKWAGQSSSPVPNATPQTAPPPPPNSTLQSLLVKFANVPDEGSRIEATITSATAFPDRSWEVLVNFSSRSARRITKAWFHFYLLNVNGTEISGASVEWRGSLDSRATSSAKWQWSSGASPYVEQIGVLVERAWFGDDSTWVAPFRMWRQWL
jgi:hypothetical protein